jgi:prepilin-type N-terminal cleavage/methylation domain-containing protein
MIMKSNRANGFSLVELMVALVAGLIVSYAVVAFTMSSLKSNAEYVQSSRLTQELRNSLDLVSREIRRAGYDENYMSFLSRSDGVTSAFTPVLLDNSNPSPTSGSCIIYAYDRANGTPGTVDVDNGEVRAIRRVVVTPVGASAAVGVIEYAASASGTRPACNGATADYSQYPPVCDATSHWCALSDPSTLNITQFNLTETASTAIGSNPSAIRIRNIAVAIQGRLSGDNGTNYLGGVSNSYMRGVATTVKIRSECTKLSITNCNISP